MDDKKIELGQFFTKKSLWLTPHIIETIKTSQKTLVVDPFAGNGDIFQATDSIIPNHIGYDIDIDICNRMGWAHNDSLLNIEKTDGIIITNPPYLAKNSAKRKKLDSYKYFYDNQFQDLYQLAISKCLEAADSVIAIVPETLILSNLFIDKAISITILEENCFDDTEVPVCVAYFRSEIPHNGYYGHCRIYKNDTFISDINDLELLIPTNKYKMKFNDPKGNIGLRGVDGQSSSNRIMFCKPDELFYDLSKICISSRAISVINVHTKVDIEELIKNCNLILNEYRDKTKDITLAPFKGNNKNNTRRRRLDFATARAIIEKGIDACLESTHKTS